MSNRVKPNEADPSIKQQFGQMNVFPVTGATVDSPFVRDQIREEGREYLINYLGWLGFRRESEVLVLPSTHHYFYDAEEMRSVKVIANLKELNRIKDIKGFLHSLYINLQPRSYFLGCFTDNRKGNIFLESEKSDSDGTLNEEVENSISSRIPFLNLIYNLMDSRTNNYLSGRLVSLILSESGFKVLDMKSEGGLTYFCTQRLSSSEN
ncbi:MAG: hypothetical protein U0X39_04410 [Bacteroidales bacterium]